MSSLVDEFLLFAGVALSRFVQTSPKIQYVNGSKHPHLLPMNWLLEDQQSCSHTTEWVETLEGSIRSVRCQHFYQPEACWTHTAWDLFAFVHQSVQSSGSWQKNHEKHSSNSWKIRNQWVWQATWWKPPRFYDKHMHDFEPPECTWWPQGISFLWNCFEVVTYLGEDVDYWDSSNHPPAKHIQKIYSTDVSFNSPWGQCPLIGCIYRWPWRVG